MKYHEFMTSLIDSYGEYKSDIMKKMTAVYIQERFEEPELEKIFMALITKLNPKYGKPVTPADFEEIFPSNNIIAEANEWYDKLTRTGSSLDNIMISNKRAEIALESFGGWVCLCQRNPEYEGLHRKNFVDAYKKTQDTGEPAKLIYGESSRKFEKQPLMIGDKDKCLEMLNQQPQQINSDIF
jgi:hypothetical protein